jgi:hypothetical protein
MAFQRKRFGLLALMIFSRHRRDFRAAIPGEVKCQIEHRSRPRQGIGGQQLSRS